MRPLAGRKGNESLYASTGSDTSSSEAFWSCGISLRRLRRNKGWKPTVDQLKAMTVTWLGGYVVVCSGEMMDAPIDICHRRVIHHPRGRFYLNYSLFPRASERRVLPIVGVCLSSSHLHIFSSSHLLIFTCSHPHIFTSSHLHIFSSSSHIHILISSHLLIFTSSHLHILTSSHLLNLHTFSSSHFLIIFTHSHLLIFTSSHLHIFSSSHLLIFTSSHLHIFTSSHPHIFTSSHPHIFTSSPLALLPSPSFLFLFWRRGQGQCQRDGTKRNPFARNDVRSPKLR